LKTLHPYAKSKCLAEKAAWKFVEERKQKGLPCFELAVINPGFVMGPLLHDTPCTSIEFVERLMMRKMPLIPCLSMPICDVRDVALAHIRAMLTNEAVNNRHIVNSQADFVSIKEIALILEAEFKKQGYNVPTSQAPNLFIKMFSIFDKPVRQVNMFIIFSIFSIILL
jgi:nucleoside-diphosphate-sugar epimerase